MQIALVNGQRHLPQQKLRGTCPVCGQETISKCGSVRLWHWAHQGRRHCDPWWENETDWHRAWKSQFPEDCREVVHFDEVTGEKHVADVKTRRGMVIELQHSAMPLEELQSREKFYGRMIWIVDGQPFASQFEVNEYPLPHPKSTLLEDVVFDGQYYFSKKTKIPDFYRISEYKALQEKHKKENILDDDTVRRIEMIRDRAKSSDLKFIDVELSVMPNRYSYKTIEKEIIADYRGHHFFCWRRPRQVWMEASAPVFFDFGTNKLFRLMRYQNHSWCVQRISKQALVEKNGGIYSFIAKK